MTKQTGLTETDAIRLRITLVEKHLGAENTPEKRKEIADDIEKFLLNRGYTVKVEDDGN